jgi:hypothetical protein
MISIKKIVIALSLSLVALAATSNNSFVNAITDAQAVNDIATSANDNMLDFLAATADVLADNGEFEYDIESGNRHQRYVGMGFALSMSNGNPHTGECNGNGHLGNTNGTVSDKSCGEPSPSD